MNVVYWICAGLFVLLAGTSGLFYALHLSTGEDVPRERAAALFRWAVVVVLGSFNIWVFKRVIDGIRALF
jgi:hypothetical protein